MAKSLCHLLMKVNHVIVAIYYVSYMSFNTIRENEILAKDPNLQYLLNDIPYALYASNEGSGETAH